MSEICQKLHELFNSVKKHSFPFKESDIPENGIYILFEKGELAHGKERIVRVGTHTGKDNLRQRLKEHFINEVKDRSIFRKNIGRCLLNKAGDQFLKEWELTPLIRKVREDNPNIDFNKQKDVEKRVTNYMQDNFSFVIFQINEKNKRLELESKIISTISNCTECKPSQNWLGLFSPKEKIRESGLWNVNELWKEELSDKDLEELNSLISPKQNQPA
jgi:hypothetical protein